MILTYSYQQNKLPIFNHAPLQHDILSSNKRQSLFAIFIPLASWYEIDNPPLRLQPHDLDISVRLLDTATEPRQPETHALSVTHLFPLLKIFEAFVLRENQRPSLLSSQIDPLCLPSPLLPPVIKFYHSLHVLNPYALVRGP